MPATTAPKRRDKSSRSVKGPIARWSALVMDSASQSNIKGSPVLSISQGPQERAVLGDRAGREVHRLDDLLEQGRQKSLIFELADHLVREERERAVDAVQAPALAQSAADMPVKSQTQRTFDRSAHECDALIGHHADGLRLTTPHVAMKPVARP